MRLFYISLHLYSDRYKWEEVELEAIERENSFEVQNPEKWSLNPEIVPKNLIMAIISDRRLNYELSIYCKGLDIKEAKEKLITEMRIKTLAIIQDGESRLDILKHAKLVNVSKE